MTVCSQKEAAPATRNLTNASIQGRRLCRGPAGRFSRRCVTSCDKMSGATKDGGGDRNRCLHPAFSSHRRSRTMLPDKRKPDEQPGPKDLEEELETGLEDTFPASDPVSAAQT